MMGTTTSTTPTTSHSSSSSSCVSITSFDDDDVSVKSNTLKFVCSYGGKILPRYPEGKLRYIGGETRVLAVDRSSVTFSDLLGKMGELCGWGRAVRLRCQMPTEDLDALVSVTSDEDLANLVEEYDLAGRVKIRAFLHPSISATSKGISQPAVPTVRRCVHRLSHHARVPVGQLGFGKLSYYYQQHHHQYHHHHHQQQQQQQYLVHQ